MHWKVTVGTIEAVFPGLKEAVESELFQNRPRDPNKRLSEELAPFVPEATHGTDFRC